MTYDEGVPAAQGPEQFPAGWPLTAEVRHGQMHVGGVSLARLAATCGTPLPFISLEMVKLWPPSFSPGLR